MRPRREHTAMPTLPKLSIPAAALAALLLAGCAQTAPPAKSAAPAAAAVPALPAAAGGGVSAGAFAFHHPDSSWATAIDVHRGA